MMTMLATALTDSLQGLIDARLDTIDRMLIGRMPRADRLAIVREVESQIEEVLSERNLDDLTREDVLNVLARLDPPEAYLPDSDSDERVVRPSVRPAGQLSPATRPSPRSDTSFGKAGGILGIVGLVGVLIGNPILWLLILGLRLDELGLIALGVFALITLGMGITATVLSLVGIRQRNWAIVGLVTGIVTTLFTIVAALLILFIA